MSNPWSVLKTFSMLLVNNNRSKAYLQSLIRNGYMPDAVVVLDASKERLPENNEVARANDINTKQKFIQRMEGVDSFFDEKEHIITTLNNHGIKYLVVNNIDINAREVCDAVKGMEGEYMIYSGPGGYILGEELLNAGKYFLHVHPGDLPEYKGSTTIYYSLLNNDRICCSVIILTAHIDGGPIFFKKQFSFSGNVNFDTVLDPIVRTETLITFFKETHNKAPVQIQKNTGGNTFYIIHPVLKHCAMLSLAKDR